MCRPFLAFLFFVALTQACATTATVTRRTTTPRPHRTLHGDEFRVVATSANRAGDAYDASLLFDRATRAVHEGRCDEALADYDRLIAEFPENIRVQPAQFNRGLCLRQRHRLEEAANAMRAASQDVRDADLARDALFQLAVLGESASSPTWVIEATDRLLARTVIAIADRIEALARRAAAQLAQGNRDEAERTAQQVSTLTPTADSVRTVGDDTYVAQARVILAEVTRMRAVEVVYRADTPGAEDAIVQRVTLTTHAHAQYNEAIRIGNPHWAAAAGFRIGEMYRDLYRALVDAPVPPEWTEEARAIYRRRTGDRLRPLLQGALRSWEATVVMARRNGISDNEWVRRADQALEDLRILILNVQPPVQNTPPRTPRSGPTA
jgi:tetratricopeptide (TPR) repeat protein